MKLNRVAAVISLFTCLQPHTAFACRYSVRDIGFVDLGAEPYRLYGYVSQDTPVESTSALTRISNAALLDSNVHSEVVNTDSRKDHPALKYLDLWRIQSFPAAILVSPDGQSLLVPVTNPNQPFEETLRSALDDIVSSPKRDEILQHIGTAYAVVLLFEGHHPNENATARKAASGAIERVRVQMAAVPESVMQPPVLIVSDLESFPRERILLWSLGLNSDKLSEPCVAVLYGRMRWIGPLMKGEEISESNLIGILSVIGANCECGLDISWTRGTMLPVRWNNEMRARVAKALGFDPEHPMVKMEASGILRRGFSYPGAPFGYVELAVESEHPSGTQELPLDEDRSETVLAPPSAKMESDEPVRTESNVVLKNALYLFAGLAALIIIGGLFILFRTAVRRS